MNKLKRILALAGVVLLAGLYISTLVFALLDSSAAVGLFKLSVAGTILVPVLLYGILLFHRLSHPRDLPPDEEDAPEAGDKS